MSERVKEWVRERLRWEDWERWLPRTIEFAKEEIRRRRWRGRRGGVLPEGYDANSVAAEVIAGVLLGKCRVALGWTPERLEKELRRLVSNEVRRLHSLKEAAGMRSEWEVLPPGKDEQPRSVFAGMGGSGSVGVDEVLDRAREKVVKEVEAKVAARLDGDEVVKELFWCLCNGVVKRREIAARLGIDVRAVTNGRKRLERKLGRRWWSDGVVE